MAAIRATAGYDRMQEVKEFDESKIGVKGLSDSGITSIPRMFIHPPETLADLKSSSTHAGIPVIDLFNVNSISHRPKIVEQIREAASTWGFFQVINHGVPLSVLDETVAAMKSFHEQPQEVKAKQYFRDEALLGVGYQSNVDLYRSKAASWYDFINVSMAPGTPQVDRIPAVCRNEVVAWDKHATKVAETIAELLSEGLGLDPRKFKELNLMDSRLLLGMCYPYCPQPDLTVGLSRHTDGSLLTVLLPNQVPGLQVKPGEEWVDVKPLRGGLIVNIGDFLQIMSNGEYKSITHRVVANSNKDPRISIVEFFDIDKENGIETYGPLPELLSPEKPAIYRNFTTQELKESFYDADLDKKSLIEKIKI